MTRRSTNEMTWTRSRIPPGGHLRGPCKRSSRTVADYLSGDRCHGRGIWRLAEAGHVAVYHRGDAPDPDLLCSVDWSAGGW